ncbi:MAG TPA: MlaD family protein [candidate division Zixibacteria bacterium]|mgnify:CR=1 FL=1|nr:MlaD family protein [candidate division Zixibacteria bacterium]
MAAKNIEFRVGVIILIGIALIAVSLYWLQGYKLEQNAHRIMVRFDDVGTLSVGDKVTVSGVNKGKVNGLTLLQGGVEVELLVHRDVILRKDAVIVIKNLGLMGERFVAITPGRSEEPFDFDQIHEGQYDTGLPEVMGLMGEMIGELRELVGTFKKSVGDGSTLDKFHTTIDNLEQVSRSLATYMDRNEAKMNETAVNLRDASRKINQLLNDNGSRVDSTAIRFDRASQRIEMLVYQLDTLAMSAREFADGLNNPDGTMRLLMDDRRLYDDLRRTADNIDDLVTDIRANPRKYINLKLELF